MEFPRLNNKELEIYKEYVEHVLQLVDSNIRRTENDINYMNKIRSVGLEIKTILLLKEIDYKRLMEMHERFINMIEEYNFFAIHQN